MKDSLFKNLLFLSVITFSSLVGEIGLAQSREEQLIARGKDDIELVRYIRDRIIEESKERKQDKMTNYSDEYELIGRERWSGKSITSLEMIALKGGSFMMGSLASDKKAKPDEKPNHQVKVSPFWIGKYEVMRGQYRPFSWKNFPGLSVDEKTSIIDILSSPSEPVPYQNSESKSKDLPSTGMTQHAANKFCQWLSYKTGRFYRLPTEAEWEYACRAGTKGRFSCPENRLGEYVVFDPEFVRFGAEKVGTKKPNPWGLFNMHGNVIEWCLDQYDPNGYSVRKLKAEISVNPIARPAKKFPRIARGGSWYDPAEDCRSAKRSFSDADWEGLSIWWVNSASWLGFRVVRPHKIPSTEEMYFYWNCDGPEYLKEKAAEKK